MDIVWILLVFAFCAALLWGDRKRIDWRPKANLIVTIDEPIE